ncbi:MAG: DUF1615 domain-containing protein [Dechloromonas sp.]|nr:DUF1615 domain-containing protein [Dechloromonas sp.]
MSTPALFSAMPITRFPPPPAAGERYRLARSACGLLLIALAGCSGIDESTDQTAASGKRPWSSLDKPTLQQRVTALLPRQLKNRQDWAADLITAYDHLQIRASPENFCATVAVIAQESGFQVDPPVAGLPKIVQGELERRAERLGLPKAVVLAALQLESPNGQTYQQRIDALRTEKHLSALYEDIVAYVPLGERWLADYNPVRTAGPMQVSIRFAEQRVSEKGYPYAAEGSIRAEVFSRRGGVYFGSAILLDYPAPYTEMRYRFADFNAGRYASRNAAFQKTLASLTGQPLVADGDLLRYENGQAAGGRSAVETALRQLSVDLRLSSREIRRDLLAEKTAEFAETDLYQNLYRLAEARGIKARRQTMPEITLQSPKITRQLTTEWFANRVDQRYKACLKRAVE